MFQKSGVLEVKGKITAWNCLSGADLSETSFQLVQIMSIGEIGIPFSVFSFFLKSNNSSLFVI